MRCFFMTTNTKETKVNKSKKLVKNNKLAKSTNKKDHSPAKVYNKLNNPVGTIANKVSVQDFLSTRDDQQYVSGLWAFTLAVNAINTGRINSPEEMEDRIQKLFDLCSKSGQIPTYENLALACGIPIRTFYSMNSAAYPGYVAYQEVIKRAKDVVSTMESGMARDGKIPASLWQFRAKNFLGMRDIQQIQPVQPEEGDKPMNKDDLLSSLPESPETNPNINVKSSEKKD